ncbi:MAG: alkaline phosphatase family protein [Bdellovibrionales bacterium]|nr:alkaline phosphatase family protein [Bdellovibrionales bacterium]
MRFVPLATLFVFAVTPAIAGNVIFITLDGVRYQEFFGGVQKPGRATRPRGMPLFPKLRSSARAGEAWIYGDGRETGEFRVGNLAALSLPGYRAMLSGEFEDRCRGNDCENIDRETIFDGMIDRGFPARDVTAFTSWDGLGRALESHPGRITRDVDRDPYPTTAVDPDEKSRAEAIMRLDSADRPIWGARRDAYTFSLAKLYLERHRPRFLYLSLLDSDEYGHLNRYRAYTDALLRYDGWIAELRDLLAGMGEYGEDTSIVVTTDHGRGRGWFWATHGKKVASSFRTWAVVLPSAKLRSEGVVRPRKADGYSQLDIRPTLESLLGLPKVGAPSANRTGISLVEP